MTINRKFFSNGVAALIACTTSVSLAASDYKQIAVPPIDLDKQTIGKPAESGVSSHSTMLPVRSEDFSVSTEKSSIGDSSTQTTVWSQSINVDSDEDFPLVFISPNAGQWNLTLIDPEGTVKHSDNTTGASSITPEQINVGGESYLGKQFQMPSVTMGKWQVRLSAKTSQMSAAKNDSSAPEGYLMFKGDSTYKLYTHLDNKFTVTDSKVNLVAYLVNVPKAETSREQMSKLNPQLGTMDQATVNVTMPDNSQVTLSMNDSGINGDELAGDGRYTAQLPTQTQGLYTYQVQVQGTRPDGLRYSRTVTDLYPVEHQSYRFTPRSARLNNDGSYRAEFAIALRRAQVQDQEVFAAAEVWGTNAQGELQAAAWIAGVVAPQSIGRRISNINLGFDLRWLDLAKLNAPYELRNLRLQTIQSNTPIAAKKRVKVAIDKAFTRLNPQTTNSQDVAQNTKQSTQITQEMLMGAAPQSLKSLKAQSNNQAQAIAATSKLLLVHGYCSGSVWDTSQFSNAVEFRDFNQSRSHDAFARKIRDTGAPYSSFGIIAHSQGGAASLQLFAKYWTGLDQATGGRIIQSVGTPYQGTALAGNLAALGEVFGVGCGKNSDLTYNGAANWLSTIPNWARAEVDYYTTSFEDRPFLFDHCNVVTDLLLSDPEDGTTERSSGQLPGGVNRGHKEGWCHTTNMRDPAQYRDTSRNSSMNSRAAR